MPSELLTGCRCGADAAPLWAEMPKNSFVQQNRKTSTLLRQRSLTLDTKSTHHQLHQCWINQKLWNSIHLNLHCFIVWIQRWTCPLSWQLWTSLHEEPCWGGTPHFPWSTTTCWPSRTIKVKVSEPVVANWTSCLGKEFQLPSHQTHKINQATWIFAWFYLFKKMHV